MTVGRPARGCCYFWDMTQYRRSAAVDIINLLSYPEPLYAFECHPVQYIFYLYLAGLNTRTGRGGA